MVGLRAALASRWRSSGLVEIMWIKCEKTGLQSSDAIRITAGGKDGFFGGFHVGNVTLNEASAVVYDRLDKIVEWADRAVYDRDQLFAHSMAAAGFDLDHTNIFGLHQRQGVSEANPASGWSDWSDEQRLVRQRLLHSLADAGRDLYKVVFRDPMSRSIVDNVKASLLREYEGEADSDTKPDRRLIINPDSTLHVPWGLLYDPAHDECEIDSSSELSAFGGFWAMRYELAVTSQPAQFQKQRRSFDRFGILSLVEPSMQALVDSDLGHQGCEELFHFTPIGTVNSVQALRKEIGQTHCVDVLFHYFGHQENNYLVLGNDRINIQSFCDLLDEIARLGERHRSDSFGLVFLNACRSAHGRGDYSLLAKISEIPDFCGAIVTEAAVRRPFAAEFARRFLRLLCSGRTLSQAITRLRRTEDLWPESLVYGCYASPDYCLRNVPPQVVTPA